MIVPESREEGSDVKELLPVIGIELKRLKLECVSASEGEKFARVTNELVEEVKSIERNVVAIEDPKGEIGDLASNIAETNVYYCAECGKCTGICPVSEFKYFSSRVTVADAIFGFESDVERVAFDGITCGRCVDVCHSVVDHPEFTRRVRRRMLLRGSEVDVKSSQGNLFLSSARIMTQTEVTGRSKRFEELKTNHFFKGKALAKEHSAETLYFMGCSPLYGFLFEDVGLPVDMQFQKISDEKHCFQKECFTKETIYFIYKQTYRGTRYF
jgi:heterodisulfide reductase subunit C